MFFKVMTLKFYLSQSKLFLSAIHLINNLNVFLSSFWTQICASKKSKGVIVIVYNTL